MTTSMTYLALSIVLAIVQVLIAAGAKRQQDGMEWGAGTRDTPAPAYSGIAGRMARAQANLYETLPLMIGAVLLAHAAGRDGALAAWGSALYFWARLAYVPAYAYGLVPGRTLIWTVSIVGLVLVLVGLA